MLCLGPVRDSGSGAVKAQGGSGTFDDDDDDGEDFRGLAEIRSCKLWVDEVHSAGLIGFGLGIA